MRSRAGAALRSCGVLVTALLLWSCGGGGGGDAGGDAPQPGGGAGSTGLIPAAPAPGAVLQADATALLPLRAGSVWHYRGQYPGGGSYGAVTRLQAAGSEFSAVHDARGETTATVYGIAAGHVLGGEDLETGNGPATPLRYTLLRSPVRQGDQVTMTDIAAVPTGEDVDGDRVNDSADLAAYSRVVGVENVELPDLRRTLAAIRVDTTVQVRFHMSRSGQPTPVVSYVQSDWYAAGIGIVRSLRTQATIDGSLGAFEFDERLVCWDGVTEGLGALPAERVVTAAAPHGLGAPWSAVRIGDRAIVATERPGGGGTEYDPLYLWAFDARGALTANRAETDPGSLYRNRRLQLLALGEAVGLATVDVGPAGALRLRRYARDLSRVGPAAGTVLLPSVQDAVDVAADGQALWVAWVDAADASGEQRLWLRRFAADGQPAGDALRLDGGRSPAGWQVRVAAAAGRVLVVWSLHPAPAPAQLRHAVVAGGAAPVATTLLSSNGYSSLTPPKPVVQPQGQWLVWTGTLGLTASAGGDMPLRAVAIGDDGQPRRQSADPAFNGERLLHANGYSITVPFCAGPEPACGAAVAADGSALTAVVARRARLLDSDSSERDTLWIDRWPWGAGATAVDSRWLRAETVGISPSSPLGVALFALPFDDRLLVLGNDAGALTRSVVFRR